MLLPIVLFGNPKLRKVSEDIDITTHPELDKLVADMWQTMEESDGVGLAAPQIGKNIRLFVIDASAFTDMDPECEGYRKAFFNAHILERSGSDLTRNEGCLSVPGIHEDVTRKECIKMRYTDINGVEHIEEFDGVKAWIIQHEYDHLDGILFTDHLSALKKRLLKGKLNAISQGKVNVRYRVVLPR